MSKRGKYLVALAAQNKEVLNIPSFSEVKDSIELNTKRLNQPSETITFSKNLLELKKVSGQPTNCENVKTPISVPEITCAEHTYTVGEGNKENLKAQQYDNTDGNIEISEISEKESDLLNMYPELQLMDDCLIENHVEVSGLDRQPASTSCGDITQMPIIFLPGENPTQMEFDLCENENPVTESNKISDQNDDQISQYENMYQNVVQEVHYERSEEEPISVNNFKVLESVPVSPAEYREESSVDDSDLDPTYEPTENDKPNMKNRTFSTNEISLSDTTDSDNNDLIDEQEKEVGTTKKRKMKRARTEAQKRKNNLKKYKVLPECSCKKKCFQFFSTEERKNICEAFWKLSFGERRQYFNAFIKKNIVKTRRTDSNNKRQCSLTYSMTQAADGSEKQVCKTMFLHTHGLKTDGMITEFKRQQNMSKGLNITKDGRGKAVPPNKKDSIIFKTHINSFNPQVSHYKLLHAPHRRYLPSDISISDMWKDFCQKYEKVSYEKYRNEFNLENIGFDQPNQDDCNVCALQKEHVKVCQQTNDNENAGAASNCSPCIDFNLHHELYTEGRAAYQKDRDTNFDKSIKLYAVDMQKILLLPKMSLKSSVFISRLVIFNETFAALNKPFENICVIWHEAISGRNSEDVASSYCAIIKRASVETKHYIFWCDNCSAQNKNWKLYAALCSVVNAEWGPITITIKYFEAGHTFMKADVVHGQIGKAMKRSSNIYDLHDLNELILKTSRQNKTLLLNFDDFYNFKEGSRQRRAKDTSESLPTLNNIRVVEFRKGSRHMFFKIRHTQDEFLCSDFLKSKFDLSIPETNANNRGINAEKKQKILTDLVPSMPALKRLFWEKLPISGNSSDLLTTQY